jgi:Heparinase II/III-like protein/Heparinase II/III N-terminus
MDVAIRIANWLLAWDLFRAAGWQPDGAFEEVFARSVTEHGTHLAGNLEWSSELRGNHYLADVIGLLFASAYLPPSARVDAWLLFATRETINEIVLQFHDDGGNFEGSTCYHRLSAEMATYAVALLLALPASRLEGLFEPSPATLAETRAFPGSPLAGLPVFEVGAGRRSPVPPALLERLGRARSFTTDLTKPSGRVPQFGDDDSGRFYRLAPVIERLPSSHALRRYRNLDGAVDPGSTEPFLLEDHLDHRHLVDAIDGLLGRGEASDLDLDGSIVRALARPEPGWADLGVSRADRVRIGNDQVLADFEARLADLTSAQRHEHAIDLGISIDDAVTVAYPVFGAYALRTDRVLVAVRCGPRGQRGFGGHDHNDQLTVELSVDGEDWIRDPGSYLYTPIPEIRAAYRSIRAHFCPQLAGAEPASLDDGPFILGRGGSATCVYWGERGFAGESRTADGRVALCRVEPRGRSLRIVHGAENATLVDPAGSPGHWRAALPGIAYSPGYGIVER